MRGRPVDVVTDDLLVQVFHRGVLVVTPARPHPLEVGSLAGGKKPRHTRGY